MVVDTTLSVATPKVRHEAWLLAFFSVGFSSRTRCFFHWSSMHHLRIGAPTSFGFLQQFPACRVRRFFTNIKSCSSSAYPPWLEAWAHLRSFDFPPQFLLGEEVFYRLMICVSSAISIKISEVFSHWLRSGFFFIDVFQRPSTPMYQLQQYPHSR